MKKYIYTTNYPINEKDLALMEMRSLFGQSSEAKTFFSKVKIDPTDSPFLKGRLEVLFESESFQEILIFLENCKIESEDFKVEYFRLEDINIPYEERIALCREIGLRIIGIPCMNSPKELFGFTKYDERWYFGIFQKNSCKWQYHLDKPHSYSNSIGVKTAKAIINFAIQGDKTLKVIDTCAGIGTIVMEGLAMGVDITGVEINPIIAENARENFRHFGFAPKILTDDMHNISESYDVSILDLPYGIFSHITATEQQNLINKTREISKRMIFVSFENLEAMVLDAGFEIIDSCIVPKGKFKRYIFICQSK